ncbi:hypothetical protein [Nonomuraea basaltis]|uniref:hypothetical protein n=1 Tax=Nonomuraea basaltis TaxID=2495887 RepID=UPI00110C4D25|nr:hypothetical protein [Nonomuraea basaltis]TMR88901.1 hypothetical protein EJK15_63735 [Nonomuraea basaltis]
MAGVPGRSGVAGDADVVVGRFGREHRPDHLLLVPAEVEDDGDVVDLHGLADGRIEALGAVEAQTDAAVRLAQKAGSCRRPTSKWS